MDTPIKVGLIGGASIAGYFLYRWWKGQQRAAELTEEAAVNQAIDEALQVASQTANQMQGFGALPPWPSIGPRPRPYIGPVYSLTSFSVK